MDVKPHSSAAAEEKQASCCVSLLKETQLSQSDEQTHTVNIQLYDEKERKRVTAILLPLTSGPFFSSNRSVTCVLIY